MKPIIYVAHPVSGDAIANANRATRWVRYFTVYDPTRIYIAPWVAEVLGFGTEQLDAGFYQRILDDDVEVVARLDGLVGVGGKWSGGMLQERVIPRQKGAVLDMTRFVEPTDVPLSIDFDVSWRMLGPRDKAGKLLLGVN